MQALKSAAGRYYRPELDVVRFLAFLFVYLHHILPDSDDLRIANLLKGFAPILYATTRACGFGLSLFFTLSAFLICELLLRERESVGRVGVKQFYIRRVLRIWPLYYLGLALGVVVAFLPGGNPSEAIKAGWFAIFMGAWFLTAHTFLNPSSVLWSVSVEEQFYLFAPWVVKYFNRQSLIGFCVALILVANGWLYYLGKVSAVDHRIWANSFVQFECFAAGILLCIYFHGRLPRIVFWQRLICLAGASSCWFIACYGLHTRFEYSSENPGSLPLIGGYAMGALGSVLLLIAFLGLNPKLLPGWAIYLGRISYGLYVYHEFALYLTDRIPMGHLLKSVIPNYPLRVCRYIGLTLGLPLALNVMMAALSYRYFETPFLKMKKRYAVIESDPIEVRVVPS